MTPDKPTSADLLRTASKILKNEILPVLPEEKQLDALMILSVMASAERDLEDHDGLANRQVERLKRLSPGTDGVAELCRDIRSGIYDTPDKAQSLHTILVEDTRDRVSLVNPRYLKTFDGK